MNMIDLGVNSKSIVNNYEIYPKPRRTIEVAEGGNAMVHWKQARIKTSFWI